MWKINYAAKYFVYHRKRDSDYSASVSKGKFRSEVRKVY